MEKRVHELILSAEYLGKIKCDTVPTTLPFKCAIPTCPNKFTSFEDHQKSTFKFHKFPRNPLTCLKWRAVCGLSVNAPVHNLKICSDHFILNDYERNFKEEFLNPLYRRALKVEALPTLKILPEIQEKIGELSSIDKEDTVIKRFFSHSEEQKPQKQTEVLKIVDLLRKDIEQLKKKVNFKEKRIAKLKEDLKKFDKDHTTSLNSILSQAQIDILKGEKRVFWTDDDLAHAFSLRHSGGKDFYLYLKNSLNYPLPSLGCVQAWAGN